MILMTALLCATSLSYAQCDRASAQDVLVLGNADNEIACMMGAQMTLASLAIEAGEGFYWKVTCQSTAIGNPVG